MSSIARRPDRSTPDSRRGRRKWLVRPVVLAMGAGLIVPVATSSPAQAAACSPQTVTSGEYTVVRFPSIGSCDWSAPGSGALGIEYLIVAGGGGGIFGKTGGPTGGGGGGGAGGLLTGFTTVSGTQAITVGAGGSAHYSGSNSVAFGYTALGGGSGGGGSTSSAGGSGGGGSSHSGWTPSAGAGTSGQGNDGGAGTSDSVGGGGGGKGSAGSSAGSGGYGGAGFLSSISGGYVWYARGGDGGARTGGANGSNGAANTGNGGGGGAGQGGAGGAGGSGVVVARYLTAPTFSATRTNASTVRLTVPAASGAISGYEYRVDSGSWTSATGGETVNLTESSGITVSLRATGTSIGDGAVSSVAVPTIDTQPQGVSKVSGQTTQLSVSASRTDAGVLSYQWQKSTDGGTSWANVSGGSGGTTATYTTPALSYADPKAQFRVVVTNTLSGNTAAVASSAATVTVGAPTPVIATSPADVSRDAGQTATLSTVVTPPAEGVVSYQWETSTDSGVHWNDVNGATSSSYTTPTLSYASPKVRYRVRVTNTIAGADPETAITTSSAATVTVGADTPVIGTQPGNATTRSGQSATFSVSATNAEGSLSYQWKKSVDAGSTWSPVTRGTGGTTSTYSIGSTREVDEGWYRVEVTNTLTGADPATRTTASSSATLTVGAPDVTVVHQPTDVAVLDGTAATVWIALEEPAEGTVSYQWQSRDPSGSWGNVSGGTASVSPDGLTASYTSPALAAGQDGRQYRVVATNTVVGATPATATTTSSAATVSVHAEASVAPTLGTPPVDSTRAMGQQATLTAAASASAGTVSYQWQKKISGVWWNIAGADAASYTTPNLTPGDNGAQYRVVVTNTQAAKAATVTLSDPVTVTVTAQDPVIDPNQQPDNQTKLIGQSATYSVTAALPAGGGALSYQWYRDGQAISGATGSSWTVNPVTLSDRGTYTVRVINSVPGAQDAPVTVTGGSLAIPDSVTPSVDSQPGPQTGHVGQTVTFSTTASAGAGVVTYQWQAKTPGGSWADVPGATTATHTTAALTSGDSGTLYRVVVTATETNKAPTSVTSTPVALTVAAQPPAIDPNQTPAARTPLLGDPVALAVAVATPTDGGTLSYRWFRDGHLIAGATGATLSIAGAGAADAGEYTVEVTNTLPNGNTDTVTVTVGTVTIPVSAAPSIAAHPATPEAVAGQRAHLSVGASATAGVVSYQWQVRTPGGSWADVAGATGAEYDTAVLTAGDSGTGYRVVVTSTETGKLPTSLTSDPVTITVAAPRPAVDPGYTAGRQDVRLGGVLELSAPVAPPAAGTLSYQWFRNGKPIAGATGARLVVNPVTAGDAGEYSVEVTNTLSNGETSTVTIPVATIAVTPSQSDLLTGPLAPRTAADDLSPGEHTVLVDGRPQKVTVEPTRKGTGVQITGQDFSLNLAGRTGDGKPLPLDADGNLQLLAGGGVRTEGDGFAARSTVRGFVMSTPRPLGELTTDTSGAFAATLDFPRDLAVGHHTLQVNGYTPDDEVRSISLGVSVHPATQRLSGTVAVRARHKGRIPTGRRTVLVAHAHGNGAPTAATVRCVLHGQTLPRALARQLCHTRISRHGSDHAIRVTANPRCTAGLRVRVRLTTSVPGSRPASWSRTWRPSRHSPIRCSLPGTG